MDHPKFSDLVTGSLTLLSVSAHLTFPNRTEKYASLCGVGIWPNVNAKEDGEHNGCRNLASVKGDGDGWVTCAGNLSPPLLTSQPQFPSVDNDGGCLQWWPQSSAMSSCCDGGSICNVPLPLHILLPSCAPLSPRALKKERPQATLWPAPPSLGCCTHHHHHHPVAPHD